VEAALLLTQGSVENISDTELLASLTTLNKGGTQLPPLTKRLLLQRAYDTANNIFLANPTATTAEKLISIINPWNAQHESSKTEMEPFDIFQPLLCQLDSMTMDCTLVWLL
jgi:hypothetical protein